MERKQIGFEAFGCASWKNNLVSYTKSQCDLPHGEALARIEKERREFMRQLTENCGLLCPDSARETHAAPGGSDSGNAIHRADEASEAEVGWLIHAAVIVADINLIAQLLISSQGTSAAEAVFPRDLDWIAPSLWCLEMQNLLVTRMRI